MLLLNGAISMHRCRSQRCFLAVVCAPCQSILPKANELDLFCCFFTVDVWHQLNTLLTVALIYKSLRLTFVREKVLSSLTNNDHRLQQLWVAYRVTFSLYVFSTDTVQHISFAGRALNLVIAFVDLRCPPLTLLILVPRPTDVLTPMTFNLDER